MKSNWAFYQRMTWIKEAIVVFGFINREHLMRKFWISAQQASSDLRQFQADNPELIEYNKSAKRYERTNPQPARNAVRRKNSRP